MSSNNDEKILLSSSSSSHLLPPSRNQQTLSVKRRKRGVVVLCGGDGDDTNDERVGARDCIKKKRKGGFFSLFYFFNEGHGFIIRLLSCAKISLILSLYSVFTSSSSLSPSVISLSLWPTELFFVDAFVVPTETTTTTSSSCVLGRRSLSSWSHCKNHNHHHHHLDLLFNVRSGSSTPASTTTRTKKSTCLNMMFERMSEPLINALVTSQKESAKMGLSYVEEEVMLLGIIDHPQNSRKVLNQYKITYRDARKTLELMYNDNDDGGGGAGGDGWGNMLNLNKKARNVDLPFSSNLKKSLTNAVKLSEDMDSELVNSEHVLLALLGYDHITRTTSSTVTTSTTTVNGANGETTTRTAMGAHAVLLRMDGIDSESFRISEFCRALVFHLDNSNLDDNQLVLGGGGGGKGSSSTPTLSDVGIDLTQEAIENNLDPIMGRTNEIYMTLRTLLRRRKNNPCLIGDPGVGKTAIVEGIAQILSAKRAIQQLQLLSDRDENDELIENERFDRLNKLAKLCPPKLMNHRVISIELGNLVAGTKYRGEFEERIQNVMEELSDVNAPPTIVFMDEIHTLIGAGSAEGGIDAANILKPALSRGKIQLIGATTIDEYRKCIEKDMALERRLQPIIVKEPSINESLDILKGIAKTYEKHHGVLYTNEALETMVKMSERYVTGRFLPDKAIDLLDECGSMAHMDGNAAGNNNNNDDGNNKPIVDEHMVAKIISEWTSIPTGKLEIEETTQLINLENELERNVRGQYPAVHAISRAVRRARSGLRNTNRPIASFLFCGPTGVGKTELCKQLANVYYRDIKDMIRIDMSEYMEKHSVSRLTGPPPGYIGYEEGGQLTEAVRRAPHSVVLLDELEKAHVDVLNILLQIMEDGTLTDGKGRTVCFKNVILVMTSNVGSKRILDIAGSWGKKKNDNFDGKDDDEDENDDNEEDRSNVTNMKPPPATIISPDEVLSKLQNSPRAMSLMIEAMTDSELRGAMQTALGGSPSDLLKEGRDNPKIARFLERIWDTLDLTAAEVAGTQEGEGDEITTKAGKTTTTTTTTTTTNSTTNPSFASGLLKQFQGMNGESGHTASKEKEEEEEETNAANGDNTISTNTSSSTPKDNSDNNYKQVERGMNNNEEVQQQQEEEANKEYIQLSQVVKDELETKFKPELLNRIDEIIIFKPLSKQDLYSIANLILNETIKRAKDERNINLIVSNNLLNVIINDGSIHSNKFGARPMRRTIQRYFEDTVSDVIIRGFLKDGDFAVVSLASRNDKEEVVIGGGGAGAGEEVYVRVTRESDGEYMLSKVEYVGGGIDVGGKMERMDDNNNVRSSNSRYYDKVKVEEEEEETDPIRA